jgi:hypothetical protein
MVAALIIPSRKARRHFKLGRVNRLAWSARYLVSFFSLGSLLLPSGELLDDLLFRCFRDYVGAWIETTAPRRVRRALGLQAGEWGVVRIDKKQSKDVADELPAVA